MNNSAKQSESWHGVDPVCGMQVTEASAYHYPHDGVEYRFCSEHCRQAFAADPQRYLQDHGGDDAGGFEVKQSSCCHCGHGESAGGKDPVVPSADALYFCPMCPGVEQDHPGICPKCGMALEPNTVAVEEQNEELTDMSRRLGVSAALALPVFLLAMTADLVPAWLPEILSMKRVQWIEFALATPVVLWGGWPFFVRGWQSLKSWNLNMFTLIGLGVAVAWSYSVVALLFPVLFPANMVRASGTVPSISRRPP